MSERAPDGGPAPRRSTTDPMLALSLELNEQRRDTQRLHDHQVQLASDLSELGAWVSSQRQQLDGLGDSLGKLADAVAGDQEEEEDDGRPRPVDWLTLDRDQAEEAWKGLWAWLADYLVPTFVLTREELVDCWPRHRALRDALSAMWVAQRAATDPKRARRTADVEWQLRYRPDGMKLLVELTARLRCGPGRCSIAGTAEGPVPEDNEPARPELWHEEGINADLEERPEPEQEKR